MRVLVASFALATAAVAVTTAAASPRGSLAAARACAVRWNWTPMRYVVGFGSVRPAEVLGSPCRVYVYYNGSKRNVDGWFWLPCVKNEYGGYACATHAANATELGGFTPSPNATYNPRTGLITLAGAAKPAAAPKPEEIREWRWDNGFVVPFDRRGRILPGITVEHHGLPASAIVAGCGAPAFRHELIAYCSAGGVAIYSRWPLRKGDLVAASGVAVAGTTTYAFYVAR